VFWYAVLTGLKVLTYWEAYVAGLEYLAIFYIPLAIASAVRKKSGKTGTAAGLLSMLLLPVLHAIAMTVFVLTLAPIIFGIEGNATWSFPWEILTTAPGLFLTLIGVLIVAAGVMAIIPLLRHLPALQTLVLGVIALMFAFGIFIAENPSIIKGPIAVISDIWIITGLLVIVSIMSWVGRLAAAFAGKAIGIADDGPGRIMLFPLAAIFGFIPVFIYGALLGIQIRSGF
jgi:hypothetical protein